MGRGSRLLIKEQFAARREQGDFPESLDALEHFAVTILSGKSVAGCEIQILATDVGTFMSLRYGTKFDLNIDCWFLESSERYVAQISFKNKKDFKRESELFGEDDLDQMKKFGEKMWKK